MIASCGCGNRLRAEARALGVDATFSHLPPLIDSGYQAYMATCPHGVAWYGEPTSEQVAVWARDGVA